MPVSHSFLRAGVTAAALSLPFLAAPSDAEACGGCFHPVAEVGASVVTDHRMVLKVSTRETILWDQVRYAGAPEEFAWVLPVRAGARVELSRDAWIAALDAATAPRVDGPHFTCTGPGTTAVRQDRSEGGGGGCMGASDSLGTSSDTEFGDAVDAGASAAGDDGVEIVSQRVVGPYQAVTIRAKGSETSIDRWLRDNGFAIPDEVAPVVDAYTREGFDFIALRLRPGQSVRAMRPVRVITEGADPTLPLRMVAAGIGSHVGLTLWVIGEGRYQTQSFPNAVIDETRLTWDGAANRSNLSQLVSEALASNGGRTWLTEAAIRGDLQTRFGTGANPTVFTAYRQQCELRPPQTVPCSQETTALPPSNGSPDDDYPGDIPDEDAGVDDDGGAAEDAGALDGGALDGGSQDDASAPAPPAETCTVVVRGCDGFDDLDVAARGLHAGDIWVTRLRADLPVSALTTDLRLEASPSQVVDSPERVTDTLSDPSFDPCAEVRARQGDGESFADDSSAAGCACRTTRVRSSAGTFVLIGATALLASRITRRRRRRG